MSSEMEIRVKIGNTSQLLKYAMLTISDSYGEGLEVIGFVASKRFLNDMMQYLKVEDANASDSLFGLPLTVHPSADIQPMVMAFITEPMSEDDTRQTMNFHVKEINGVK